ncbi:release factor [Peniophora sp. CONT]|nr:release factor [Peniophora sp. CONT]
MLALSLRHVARLPCRRAQFQARWLTTNEAIRIKKSFEKDLARLEDENVKVLNAVKAGHDASVAIGEAEGADSHSDVAALKQRKALQPLADAWTTWHNRRSELLDALSLLETPDLGDLAHAEATSAFHSLASTASTLPALLIPPSPTAHLSALVELKSAVGGAESSLFLKELLGVYTRYANARGWEPTLVGSQDLDAGGVKDAILEVGGEGAYDALRYESGVHRVQRVPATESAGRVHTSTVAVVVLPLAEENSGSSSDEALYKMEDIRLEVMRARGAGGQHVNKTESAVRLTHIPTGITVSMQDERSQHQNRRRAFQVLSARLMDIRLGQQQAAHRAQRRGLVKTADRSEKIRTYNEPQDRVTDHRLGKVHFSWEDVVRGVGLSAIVEDLVVRAGAEDLEATLEKLETDATAPTKS